MPESFDTSIFLDVRDYLTEGIYWLIVIGGRGIGKTYSGLDWLQEDDGMLYVRNQREEIDLCATPEGNPFKKLNKDKGYNYDFLKTRGIHHIVNEVDGKLEKRGMAISLATAGKLKGFDFSDSKRIVWDEFIPDPDLVVRFNEGQAFLRFYETVNRNRELLGEPPVPVVMLSNATQLASNALYALGIADVVENMVRNEIRRRTIPERGIRIIIPEMKELVEKKALTSLYKAAGVKSKFSRHSLDNQFVNVSLENVVKRKLIEYLPLCSFEDLYLYIHKSRNEYYVSYSHHNAEHYTELDTRELFIRRFFAMKDLMLNGTFKYESYQIKKRFINIFFKYQ